MDLDNPSYFSTFKQPRDAAAPLLRRPSPPRRPRAFHRSTSADANQELLIMGEPRLSDIAPDVLQGARRPPADDPSDDEVFVGEARLGALFRRGARRHSLGAFARERAGSGGLREELVVHATSAGEPVRPTADDHALRHASYPRKRCPQCTRGATKKTENMDDILIVSLKASEAANLWVEYFTSYFQQICNQAKRKPFKIQYQWAEECLERTPDEIGKIIERAAGVKLQLIVLCPLFLDYITENADKCQQQFAKMFRPDRTQALLLGVNDNDLTEPHKRVLPTYFGWQRMGVGRDQDENFTKEFLGQAMAIFSRVWKQQSSITQEKSYFSIFPKKIRQGQSSVFILLSYPLQAEDVLKVSIERNGELTEVAAVKRRNPYTIKITVPDALTEVTAIANVLVEQNGRIVGSRPIKCESRLRELEQILRLTDNPVEFMCQSLGFNPNNKEHLDNWLLHAFQRNLPAHFNLLSSQESPFAASVHAYKQSHEEFPTLLHFAAKFGFEKLAMQLLDCPGADIAYEIRNVFDMTPADIAESNGHMELASTLRGYMNMNEFTTMYSKLKEMSLETTKLPELGLDDECYLTPRNFESLYKICPAPRPIDLPSPTASLTNSPNGYMPMKTPKFSTVKSIQELDEIEIVVEEAPPGAPAAAPQLAFAEDKVQKELLEIIYDFKNNVHSIAQVEKLVDEWKQRNDVQKSFQEKQEQLRVMRLRFDQIQQEMKAQSRRATPFDRIRRLFGRAKDKAPAPAHQRPISSLSTSSSGSSGRMSTISGSSLGDSGTHSDNEERKNNLLGSHNEDDFKNVLNKVILEMNYAQVPAPKPIKPLTIQMFETIEEKPTRPNQLSIRPPDEYYIQFPASGKPIPGVEDKKIPGQVDYMNLSAPTVALISKSGNEKCNESASGHEYMNFKV